MEPIFTISYSEYSVAQKLKDELKCSVFLPLSAQEKGIDLLLYKFEYNKTKTLTVQVKTSRAYIKQGKHAGSNDLWFNKFVPQDNADWFILTGLYPKLSQDKDSKGKVVWREIFLAFTNTEMKEFMQSLKQKKDNSKSDKMFGFNFKENNNEIEIEQTRGYHENGIDKRNMNKYLLHNRVNEMRMSLK